MLEEDKRFKIETEIVKAIKDIYDPEIPVNIFDLGLIYEVNLKENYLVEIEMTLTTPNCPVADKLPNEVKEKIIRIKGVKDVKLKLVFDPPWDQSLMSEEAKLELGLL